MNQRYKSFDDLPEWLRHFMRRICPRDTESAIHEPIPALGRESVMSLMNQGEEGESKVRAYMTAVIGKFF